MLHFSTPPKNICIIRLSAIGDICHTLPVVRTIQSHWPDTKITWIIGKVEYELLRGVEDINFIVFDKNNGLHEYLKIHSQLKNIKFDILLHMQMSLRASLLSMLVNSKIRMGFDKKRAKDWQWLFTNSKINHISHQHVMDSLFEFSQALGISEKKLSWEIPISEHVITSSKNKLGNISSYIVISPCSSKSYRNWNSKGYAKLVDFLHNKYKTEVILTGGNSLIERKYGNEICEYSNHSPLNLIGKINLKELLYIIKNAVFIISPDSGPAHIATAMGTPVIGLYATTNPGRARPYLSAKWVVNRYPDAIKKKYHKDVSEVKWGTRVRDNWAMDLISTEDVVNKITEYMQLTTV